LLLKVLSNLDDGSYKMPTTSRRETGEKEQPHGGRKGRKRRITTFSTRLMELVATSEHPNPRKGRQKRTDARTHARTMFLRKTTFVATRHTVQKKRKENERRGGRKKEKTGCLT
jgi:hypothetical protein